MGTQHAIVWIEWNDASYQTGELTLEELNPLIRLHSVGWLLREDDESISIAMERCDEQSTYRHVTHIPKVNVVRIKRVQVK